MNQQISKVLALDIGERRIGVAIASSAAKIASPLETIDTVKTKDPYLHIAELVQEHQVRGLVIGLPRGLDGQESLQTTYVRDFARRLGDEVTVPVVMQDEAGTSVEAEKRLRARGKPYSKADIDAEAAVLILTDYIQEGGLTA